MSSDHGSLKAAKSARLLRFFEAAVVVPTLGGLTLAIARDGAAEIEADLFELVGWILIIALVELIPVPVWRGVHISMGFPLMMAVAFMYEPQAAAAPRFSRHQIHEFKREVGLLRALFNRCQVALAVGSASLIFHELADLDTSSAAQLIGCGRSCLDC